MLLTSKGGSQTLAEFFPASGQFTRVLDLTSELTMTVSASANDGCKGWDLIAPWATEIAVLLDGKVVWCGPVIDVKFNIGSADVKARDLSIWWGRRIIPEDVSFEDVDVSTVLRKLHDLAMKRDPIPNIYLDTPLTGVKVTRKYVYVESTYVKDAIGELSKSALDWTAYGRLIICRGQELTQVPGLTLYDDMWMTPPQVHARGSSQATSVTLNATENVLGVATASQEYIDHYGLIERIFDEPDIKTEADAITTAKSRLAILKDPYYIESPAGAALKPSAPVSLDQLIPGARIKVFTEATCKKIVGDFRLQNVKYDFKGEVYVDLQPLGIVDTGSGVD